MIELNEFVFKRMNLPKRFWFITPLNMNQEIRKANESYVRSWLEKLQEGGLKQDLFIMGPHSNELFSVVMQSLARRGIDCIVFHPNEMDLILERNQQTRSEWYEIPALGIHSFFEETSYDWKTRNFLYGLLKHRWLNNKLTVLASKTEFDRMQQYMENATILEDFLTNAKFLNA